MLKKRRRICLGDILIIIGAVAIIASVSLWFYNDYQDSEAAEYSLDRALELLELMMAGKYASKGSPYTLLDGEEYLGIISIPELSLNLPVNRKWSYAILKKTPCRYSGNIATNDIVIFAHNYRTHFARINRLKNGDEVSFTEVTGARTNYYVDSIVTVNPSATYSVVNSSYDLTLFTCNYSGRARVVVRCLRVDT